MLDFSQSQSIQGQGKPSSWALFGGTTLLGPQILILTLIPVLDLHISAILTQILPFQGRAKISPPEILPPETATCPLT